MRRLPNRSADRYGARSVFHVRPPAGSVDFQRLRAIPDLAPVEAASVSVVVPGKFCASRSRVSNYPSETNWSFPSVANIVLVVDICISRQFEIGVHTVELIGDYNVCMAAPRTAVPSTTFASSIAAPRYSVLRTLPAIGTRDGLEASGLSITSARGYDSRRRRNPQARDVLSSSVSPTCHHFRIAIDSNPAIEIGPPIVRVQRSSILDPRSRRRSQVSPSAVPTSTHRWT